MEAMKAAEVQLVLDRSSPEAQLDQLPVRYHPVLSCGQRRQLQLTWMTFRMHVMQKVIQVPFSPP